MALLGTIVPNAEGAEFYGLAALAGMHRDFPCSRYLQIVRQAERPAMVVLWRSFGENTSCIVRFLEAFKHRPHLLEVHLSNEVCRRNGRCYEGELFRDWSVARYNLELRNLSPEARLGVSNRIAQLRGFLGPRINKNTTLAITLGLEDNFTPITARNLLSIVRPLWPYLIIRNPNLKSAPRGDADFKEYHTFKVDLRGEPCIGNEDAVATTLENSKHFLSNYRECLAVLLWRAKHQGAGRRKFTAPRNRQLDIPLSDVRDLGRLLKETRR